MKTIINAVEKYRSRILDAERYIWKNPETGFKEYKTSKYMEEQFEKLGYTLTKAEGITGFYTQIDTGREGPTVLILAELDSVICRSHPEADPETGAVHACGHNAQCAALLGVAAALTDEKVLSGLCGKIRLCAVPAEECLEMEYRKGLQRAGIIKYLGGKTEFLSRGYFDGVDMAFMVHTGQGKWCSVNLGSDSGFIAKTVVYKGATSHACAAHLAKNALYAATCGLNATNALRETFQNADCVKWHPIITHGGDIVNNIPEKVVLESQLRAATVEALERENAKINRALVGAALSFGVNIEIIDEPGYAPLQNCEELAMAAKEAFEKALSGQVCGVYGQGAVGGGTTDMGDLSMIMPVIHPYVGGASGKGHGEDYQIIEPELACVTSAKWQVATVKLLLENGAKRAKEIIANYQAPFSSKKEFLAYKDGQRQQGERIKYREDGKVELL